MGDLLAKHIGYAKQALYDIHGDPDPSIANAAHLTTYSLATYLSPYLLMRDVAKLSDAADPTASPLSIRFSDKDLDMHAEDYFHRSLPRLFPVKPAPSTTETDRVKRYEGSDRSVHGASHMFLAGLYYYARQNGLQDATRIPLAAQARISVDTFFSPTDEAKALALSRLAGYMWEVQESGKYIRDAGVYYGWSKWFAAGAVPPPLRGLPFIDPLVENDYQANEFGAHLGISLNRPDLSDQTLTQIMTRINADDLYAA